MVVGNFQVVDPNGDLRKLFYRVEGTSGFVITDQQVMVGFSAPPPAPETYNSARRVTQEGGAQGGAEGGHRAVATTGDERGLNSKLLVEQTPAGDSGQFGDDFDSFPAGFEDDDGSIFVFDDVTSGDGGGSFSDAGSSSSGQSAGSSEGGSSGGDSSEGGSSEGDSSFSEGGSVPSVSGALGTDEQISEAASARPITSQVTNYQLCVVVVKFNNNYPNNILNILSDLRLSKKLCHFKLLHHGL